MRITFITLFPDFFEEFKKHSIIKNAIKNKIIEIEIVNIRDFSRKGKVDDTVYGGGAGMLLMIEPLVKAINSVKTKNSKILLLGPRGNTYSQSKAKELKKENHLILISGHYEGIDARIKHYIDGEISIGNFIVTGGEIPSMLVADSIIRLVNGVIKEESFLNESFENDLLEWDNFTKPIDFEGHKVPEVLLSGNHKYINQWRKESAMKKTIEQIIEKHKK